MIIIIIIIRMESLIHTAMTSDMTRFAMYAPIKEFINNNDDNIHT